MQVLFFIGFILFLVIIIYLWATSIDKMKNEHPDYKGEDFLNEKDGNSLI